jgi:hypothetical protein
MTNVAHPQDPVPVRAASRVRVVIPASVAYDLGKFQKSLVNLAERLGCRPCLSGADCTFQIERDFVINPASLAVTPAVDAVRDVQGG